MIEATDSILAVNGCARTALAPPTGPASPVDRRAVAWTAMTAALAQIIRSTIRFERSRVAASVNHGENR